MSTRTRERSTKRRQEQQAAAALRRHARRNQIITVVVAATLAAVVGGMMWTARSTTSETVRTAPAFTLTDTTGSQVSLPALRGQPVVLYFSEGAGCGSCLQQMAAIEQQGAFRTEQIRVLPIVMNSRAQITTDMKQFGVTTPFLLDDGSVSRAYGMLGKGMHAGLPGHGFVLVDALGNQRWKGEYPSMWLAPNDLLQHVRQHLAEPA